MGTGPERDEYGSRGERWNAIWDRDGSGDGAGMGTGTAWERKRGGVVETCREKQDGNGDGNGDGNESSSGDGNGDGNEDGIKEGKGEAKKRKKSHITCRRDQALLFRTQHHL